MPDPNTEPNLSQPRLQVSMVIRNIGQLVTVAQQPILNASWAFAGNNECRTCRTQWAHRLDRLQ